MKLARLLTVIGDYEKVIIYDEYILNLRELFKGYAIDVKKSKAYQTVKNLDIYGVWPTWIQEGKRTVAYIAIRFPRMK